MGKLCDYCTFAIKDKPKEISKGMKVVQFLKEKMLYENFIIYNKFIEIFIDL